MLGGASGGAVRNRSVVPAGASGSSVRASASVTTCDEFGFTTATTRGMLRDVEARSIGRLGRRALSPRRRLRWKLGYFGRRLFL